MVKLVNLTVENTEGDFWSQCIILDKFNQTYDPPASFFFSFLPFFSFPHFFYLPFCFFLHPSFFDLFHFFFLFLFAEVQHQEASSVRHSARNKLIISPFKILGEDQIHFSMISKTNMPITVAQKNSIQYINFHISLLFSKINLSFLSYKLSIHELFYLKKRFL